jgi:plasmid stabilization system protein ParE
MTGPYLLRPGARTDLKDIWRYTAARWGNKQAQTYTNQIRQQVQTVAANPHIGWPCPELRAERMPTVALLIMTLPTEMLE